LFQGALTGKDKGRAEWISMKNEDRAPIGRGWLSVLNEGKRTGNRIMGEDVNSVLRETRVRSKRQRVAREACRKHTKSS
jgi:hypothetical protein